MKLLKLIGKDIYNLNNSQKIWVAFKQSTVTLTLVDSKPNEPTRNQKRSLRNLISYQANRIKGQGFPYNLNADIGVTYIDTTAKNGAYNGQAGRL